MSHVLSLLPLLNEHSEQRHKCDSRHYVTDAVILTKWCGMMYGVALGKGNKFALPQTDEYTHDQIDIEIKKIYYCLEAGPLDSGSWNFLSV